MDNEFALSAFRPLASERGAAALDRMKEKGYVPRPPTSDGRDSPEDDSDAEVPLLTSGKRSYWNIK